LGGGNDGQLSELGNGATEAGDLVGSAFVKPKRLGELIFKAL
jgi:hypothetical protein